MKLLTSGVVTLFAAVSLAACGSSGGGGNVLPNLSTLPAGNLAPTPHPSSSPAGGSSPSASPSPKASASPSPKPSASPSPGASSSPSPKPSASPSPAGSPSPSPAPTASPTPSPILQLGVVTPIFDCIGTNGTSNYVLLGYKSTLLVSGTIAAGSTNNAMSLIVSGQTQQYTKQPSVFQPGLHDKAFQVTLPESNSKLIWNLDGTQLGPISTTMKAC